MSSFQLIFNKHCHMIDIDEINNIGKKDLVCINFPSTINIKSIQSIPSCITNSIKYLRFLGHWKFEYVVKAISLMEDKYQCPINGIDIDTEDNRRLFFDLCDFYGADIQLNAIANRFNSPFEIIQDIFSSPELSSFYRYGISLDLNSLDGNLWLNENIFKSIKNYVFAYSDFKSKIYGIR